MALSRTSRDVCVGSVMRSKADIGQALPMDLYLIYECMPQPSRMNQAPDDCARRAQPQKDGSAGLNAKTPPAFCGGLRIAGHVENAAGDPDQAQHGGDGIADVDRKQPQ